MPHGLPWSAVRGSASTRGTGAGTRMSLPNDRELDLLRSDLESDRVERKRSAAERGKIRRNICAFANDLPAHDEPGVIFIGVEDDGRCANLEIGDRLLRTLADMRDDGNILPVPSFTVQKRFLSGCEVVALIVEPSRNPPVRYQGRVWIKVGPTVRQATPDEELRLSERRRAADRPFDSRPVRSASVEDLDLDRLKTGYLPLAVAPDELQENRRPLGQQLHSLRLLVHDVPVWGAILGFGRDPRSMPGSLHATPSCTGTTKAPTRPSAFTGTTTVWRSSVRAGSTEGSRPRTSEHTSRTTVTPLSPRSCTILGFAQRFGLGIPLARQKLKANGNPEPEFDFRPVQVTVTVRPAP